MLYRIIADHFKASVFLLSEGVTPSNLKQGYVLRRLIRRQIRAGYSLTMNNKYEELFGVIENMYGEVYPEIKNNKDFILAELKKEFDKFILTLKNGLKEFEKIEKVSGKIIFDLYQTYGFPIELSFEEIRKKGIKIDEKKARDEFFIENNKHQELSRTASAGMFKGGLADAGEQATKYHTATHLLLAGLRKILGDSVFQKGSNITAERMRFDFSWPEKLSTAQIQDAENFVNDIIKKDLPVVCQEVTLDEAKKMGAMGVFESKYGQKVKVYTILDGDTVVSREICGGPHVEHTGLLGHFKIQKEESSSAGVRRIKAILE